jgi:hypothetical protein
VIRGCADGLEYCPFIPDKVHRWPSRPDLTNRRYINSGGFYAPSSSLEFFEYLRRESLDDAKWECFTIDHCLYDNHFLCAYLNLCDTSVDFLDSLVYGWRGFLLDGALQVTRLGSHLLNTGTQKPLALILFAGVQQSPELLRSLPGPIASLLFERIAAAPVTRDEAIAGIYAALSPVLSAPIPDAAAQDVLATIAGELPTLIRQLRERPVFGRAAFLFPERRSHEGVCFCESVNPSTWNGLQCGGAYLDAQEYRFLRQIVRDLWVRTVVETGAGETSVLFRTLGVRTVSIEYQTGPWFERAAMQGCDCVHVPFDHGTAMYSEPTLGDTLRAKGIREVDLLLIDSPVGTRNREKVLSQLLASRAALRRISRPVSRLDQCPSRSTRSLAPPFGVGRLSSRASGFSTFIERQRHAYGPIRSGHFGSRGARGD